MDTAVRMAHEAGISVALVTKCVCADKRIVDIVNQTDADFIADSRLENLMRMDTCKPKMLLRIAMQSEVELVARHANISLQSDIGTIQLLAEAVQNYNSSLLTPHSSLLTHKVILMIDMGDLREGIFFRDEEGIFAAAKAVVESGSLELYGVGVNLTCFGAVLPDEENLSALADIAQRLRQRFGVDIPIVSGGNSSSMTLLREGKVPKGVNNLRLGEGYLLGNDTGALTQMENFFTDCFTLEAELVEVEVKPSKPIGSIGANAFGERVEFPDRGDMLRGILAVGRQDVDAGGLIPLDKNIEVLGASSDHLIVNLTKAGSRYKAGDAIAFNVDYGALLRAYTSAYIHKEYIN